MSNEYQAEIRERMRCDYILVPQVFVDGQHVGVSFDLDLHNHHCVLFNVTKTSELRNKGECLDLKLINSVLSQWYSGKGVVI